MEQVVNRNHYTHLTTVSKMQDECIIFAVPP
jgi:hypothetical protein